MKTKFVHVRDNDRNGAISPRGGVTYAFREAELDTIFYAKALCSPKDNFNKHYGRAKAEGRLNSGNHIRMFNGSREQFVEAVMDGVV